MLDWFVILTSLVLIPVVLLLAFVGCAQVEGLDKYHFTTPVSFEYKGDLPKDVQSLEWRFNFVDLTSPTAVEELTDWFKRTGAEIKIAGESDIVGSVIDLRSHGSITCFCQVTTKNTPPQVIPTQQMKDKDEDFSAPRFRLVRDGSSFAIK